MVGFIFLAAERALRAASVWLATPNSDCTLLLNGRPASYLLPRSGQLTISDAASRNRNELVYVMLQPITA